ncbi:CPBP family intramembrane glutamic endopeptidase [Acerihabitans sp. TG2]|uniref:CPBP family intramembrane glutamic endopeptidase n=1 Tax=Acerihabitans sp. TG2 TaxID=3096008 RepID=UPI002B23191F|nr:CPBP family intramembrane glutamic endopeptidase [Acerihabitans sp. TG2]MEA9392546.1 CPBP family intramembrane glutamic endopeptidase [Acerihabitans sp. TG2]
MWIFFAISLVLLPIKRDISVWVLLLTLCLAYINQVIDLSAVAFLVLLLLFAQTTSRIAHDSLGHLVREAILLLAAIALFTHHIPGFHNVKALDAVIAGTHSAPFTLYFNVDKALIPFLLFSAFPTLFYRQRTAKHPLWQWMLLMLSLPGLLFLAVGLKGLTIELHNPPWLWTFILANLFFVSLAEEALFRGYLQQRLAMWLGDYTALFITAVTFGLVHCSGGMLMVIFAGLAGILYGLSWMWSGRLWVSTLFHFSLNIIHLLFFTYPFYQR